MECNHWRPSLRLARVDPQPDNNVFRCENCHGLVVVSADISGSTCGGLNEVEPRRWRNCNIRVTRVETYEHPEAPDDDDIESDDSEDKWVDKMLDDEQEEDYPEDDDEQDEQGLVDDDVDDIFLPGKDDKRSASDKLKVSDEIKKLIEENQRVAKISSQPDE